jgi:hypothetical protein
MPYNIEWPEIALRLFLTIVAGILLGLNRSEPRGRIAYDTTGMSRRVGQHASGESFVAGFRQDVGIIWSVGPDASSAGHFIWDGIYRRRAPSCAKVVWFMD